jgi:hypothetical protein
MDAQGDYFEGNVAQVIVLFCISQKLSDSGNLLGLIVEFKTGGTFNNNPRP